MTYAAPHHLVADSALAGGTYAVRRTRAGDVWDDVQGGEHAHASGGCGDSCGTGGGVAGVPVGLGMPGLRPAALQPSVLELSMLQHSTP